ncbi:MAG TPA: ExbD/TolR family protein [Thermoanaerobaculia bacterium]|nr:ExbD/TolR family protein [Thermoanaerobaculia bacterium]
MAATLMPAGGRRSGRNGSRRYRPLSEINVTPFVDVMLVLLIIFMVAAPLLTTGVPINLPQTNAAALPTEQEEPLMLSIDAEGVIYLQKEPQELAVLPEKLAAVREARGEDGGKIYLRADNALSHGYVQQVLAMLRNANFASISMVHDQPRQTE